MSSRPGNGITSAEVERALIESEEEFANEEDEDEDEEEQEDEEANDRRSKKKRKKPERNRFLDIEAEDDDEEEEEEDGDDEGFEDGGKFIAGEDEDAGVDVSSRMRQSRLLDLDQEAETAEEIAERLTLRYHNQKTAKYQGDTDDVPQRMLMPSVEDPSLWLIKCKIGSEKRIVYSILNKAVELADSPQRLEIMSAFCRDSLPGFLFVESKNQQHVRRALDGLIGIYMASGMNLVPIEEMADLLKIKKVTTEIAENSWVRFRGGPYKGDLAQVIEVEGSQWAYLRYIPRIDLDPSTAGSKRRRAVGAERPPAKLFNRRDVTQIYGDNAVQKQDNVYYFKGDAYSNGFLESKKVKIRTLQTEDVNWTIDEISKFSSAGLKDSVNLAALKITSHNLQPGDNVFVYQGEQSGESGVVGSVTGDVVTVISKIRNDDGEEEDWSFTASADEVRKEFQPGNHIKVMRGDNADRTGLVVKTEGNLITFIADLSQDEITVFAKDVREAAEVGVSINTVGEYELRDIIEMKSSGLGGCIVKTHKDKVEVLDERGSLQTVKPIEITKVKNFKMARAMDGDGNEIAYDMQVREVKGDYRSGKIIGLRLGTVAFVFNRDLTANNGVFVTRCKALASSAPTVRKTAPGMLPSRHDQDGGMVGSSMAIRAPRDPLIDKYVIITRGPYKGQTGMIVSVNGELCRIEMHSINRTESITKQHLMAKDPNTGKITKLGDGRPDRPGYMPDAPGGSERSYSRAPSMQPPASAAAFTHREMSVNGGATGMYQPASYNSGAMGGATSYASNTGAYGGHTTYAGNVGKTPNPYAATRTPGYTSTWQQNSGKTPNPYAAVAKTPNPYAGKTPAYRGATPGFQPNPFNPTVRAAMVASGKTPAYPTKDDQWTPQSDTKGY